MRLITRATLAPSLLPSVAVLLNTIRPKRTPLVLATMLLSASFAICSRVLRPIGAPVGPFGPYSQFR